MLPEHGPELRDIHVPDPSWWPPAPGWWLLVVLVLALLLLLVWWLRRRWRRKRFMRQVLAELEQLHLDFQHEPDHAALAAGLSQMLRRAVRYRGGDADAANTAWFEQLDALAGGILDQETVVVLSAAPYQRNPHYPVDDLMARCRRWLQHALADSHV